MLTTIMSDVKMSKRYLTQLNQFKVLINGPLMAYGRRHFDAGHRPEAAECKRQLNIAQQFGRNSVEAVQKYVNKCEQNIIPDENAMILLELRHE